MFVDPTRQTIARDALDRYLAGESGAEESATVAAWLAAHPDQAARLAYPAAVSRPGVEADWGRVSARLDHGSLVGDGGDRSVAGRRGRLRPRAGMRVGVPVSHRRGWYPMIGLAAGALLVAIGWRAGLFAALGRGSGAATTYTTYVTAPGQRATIALPDGNTVALNVASRLDVPTNYSSGNHVVRLRTGEVLFTISHRSAAPFTVVTEGTTTHVLGTSFLVRHYATDTAVTVAVRDGKVAVGHTVVAAHQRVDVGMHGGVHAGVASPDQFTFTTGVLTIDSTLLSNAIPELNRWYNADIRLGDPALAVQPVEGKFIAGSLTDLTEILGLTFNVRVVRDGRVLTLYSRAK